MPPINLKKIVRETQERPDARRLFLLCEGTNTEPGFLEKVLTNADYIKNPEVTFVKVNKTGHEFGINDLNGLVCLANKIMEDKNNHFSKRKDKVVIIFDLDRYGKKQQNEIKTIIEKNKKSIIFVYTNPAVELFLLLCTSQDAYEKYVEPNVEEILKNSLVVSSDGKSRRYIADLFFRVSGQDSKVSTADFSSLANNIQYGINQEKIFISQKMSDNVKKLVSNFGAVLEKIKENNFDNIEYII